MNHIIALILGMLVVGCIKAGEIPLVKRSSDTVITSLDADELRQALDQVTTHYSEVPAATLAKSPQNRKIAEQIAGQTSYVIDKDVAHGGGASAIVLFLLRLAWRWWRRRNDLKSP
jgi:hypothetical protein